jgi:hypothetical protein
MRCSSHELSNLSVRQQVAQIRGRNSRLPISVLTPMPALALVLRDKISPKVSLGVGLTEENGEVFLSWLPHTAGRCSKE